MGGLRRVGIDVRVEEAAPHPILKSKIQLPPRNIGAALAGFFTNSLSLLILLELLVSCNQLLGSSRMGGPGAATVLKTLSGAFSLILFCMGWLSGLILSFRYYFNSVSGRVLASRFLFVTALEILALPALLLLRIFVFNLKIQLIDTFIVLLSLILASGALAGSRRLRPGNT